MLSVVSLLLILCLVINCWVDPLSCWCRFGHLLLGCPPQLSVSWLIYYMLGALSVVDLAQRKRSGLLVLIKYLGSKLRASLGGRIRLT